MYLVFTASPNSNGLTAACGKAAVTGIHAAGKQAKITDFCTVGIEACSVCDDGWGMCRKDGVCGSINDDFEDIKESIRAAKAIVLITPVYWGQPSERFKYFCDRFRRCEALRGEKSALFGKRVILVAAAGGSGNGTVSCLNEMALWCSHVGARPFCSIGITRLTREPMLDAIQKAAEALAR